MRRWTLFPLFVLVLYGVVVIGQQARAVESVQTTEQLKTKGHEIVVQTKIPGVTFPCTKPEFKGKQCVHSLGEFLANFYKYFAGVIGILGAFMVMLGGFKWITAGGNASRVNDAKDTIFSAIIAIVLTLGSYLLLYTINPQLVNLSVTGIDDVGRIVQAHSLCRDNAFANLILKDADTGEECDPRKEECCGYIFSVKITEKDSVPCFWDICNNPNEICRTKNPDKVNSKEGNYGCVPAFDFCYKDQPPESESGDRPAWCNYVTAQFASAKQRVLAQNAQDKNLDFVYQNKFTPYGCSIASNAKGGHDECQYGYRYSWAMSNPLVVNDLWRQFDKELADYDKKFIDCLTPEATNCWKEDEKTKQRVPRDCSGNYKPCKSVSSFPVGVLGVDGACLIKRADKRTGDASDYKCWATKFPQ